jgi:hypothetical protein
MRHRSIRQSIVAPILHVVSLVLHHDDNYKAALFERKYIKMARMQPYHSSMQGSCCLHTDYIGIESFWGNNGPRYGGLEVRLG